MLANILAVGLMASVMSFSPRYVVDNQNETLTFSAEELNNNTYQYLAEQLNQYEETPLPNEIRNATITYNNVNYAYDDYETNGALQLTGGEPLGYFKFVLDNEYENYGKWVLTINDEDIVFTQSMTINNAEWFIANIEEPPSLTLSKYDLNNKTYTYLAEKLHELDTGNIPTEITNTTLTYKDDASYVYEGHYGTEISWINDDLDLISLHIDSNEQEYGKWTYQAYNTQTEDLEDSTPFTASMTINNAQWFINNINAPLDSGDMMTAITSGLPLMANLAQAFLNGFTSIFWNSTTNTLTTFSNFALIMLSVAIVFACIKLVLNVVRSNTGV